MIGTAEMEEFFDRLICFHSTRATERRHYLEKGLQQISAQLPRFIEQAKVHEAKTSPRFNVYRILRLQRKEVLVHTPMLAELLDPARTHGQGCLFLKSFLLLLENHGFKLQSASPEQFRWFIDTEMPTGTHGNLDVLITCPDLACVVVIENKIGNSERPNQLWDYWCWLLKRKKQFPNQCLVFLTPEGVRAKTAQVAQYIPLSYHTDISTWLSDVLTKVESATVTETIRQYLQIIEDC